jgi:hypothetical protein
MRQRHQSRACCIARERSASADACPALSLAVLLLTAKQAAAAAAALLDMLAPPSSPLGFGNIFLRPFGFDANLQCFTVLLLLLLLLLVVSNTASLLAATPPIFFDLTLDSCVTHHACLARAPARAWPHWPSLSPPSLLAHSNVRICLAFEVEGPFATPHCTHRLPLLTPRTLLPLSMQIYLGCYERSVLVLTPLPSLRFEPPSSCTPFALRITFLYINHLTRPPLPRPPSFQVFRQRSSSNSTPAPPPPPAAGEDTPPPSKLKPLFSHACHRLPATCCDASTILSEPFLQRRRALRRILLQVLCFGRRRRSCQRVRRQAAGREGIIVRPQGHC